jgi:four helix bundle protein
MNKEDLKKRTRIFAVEVIKFTETLPKSGTADVICRQLVRSGTSVGANYRSSCRAKSTADFISKMGYVEEEADETMYWLELLEEAGIKNKQEIAKLWKEADEIVAMTVASIRTARKKPRS